MSEPDAGTVFQLPCGIYFTGSWALVPKLWVVWLPKYRLTINILIVTPLDTQERGSRAWIETLPRDTQFRETNNS